MPPLDALRGIVDGAMRFGAATQDTTSMTRGTASLPAGASSGSDNDQTAAAL